MHAASHFQSSSVRERSIELLPGQYFDRETNLAYNYFRDYDPAIGRYAQSDLIGLRGGLDTYLYVNAKPLSLVDPEGLQIAVPAPMPPVGGSYGSAGIAKGFSNLIKKIADFCKPPNCDDHLQACLGSDLASVKDGYQSRCLSCYDRCRGSGAWPSSLENVGTCDYEKFKLQ
jgi:RHS repeat-associated protein